MSRIFNNFKKYLIIIPIYFIYITIFELILGCSLGDIWDDLLQKFGLIKTKKTHKLIENDFSMLYSCLTIIII